MKFLRRKRKAKRVILSISDLHLGAGEEIKGRKNSLEDFHSDEELVQFFEYYSSGEYQNKEVEIVINGDFLDLLAVPYVAYFDDEYWSERACLEKLELIIKGHPEVWESMNEFLSCKNKKIVYIIGNHDAELVFDSLKERFLQEFDEENRKKITISNEIDTYNPAPGVYFRHGHQYETAHAFDPEDSIITSKEGEKYFIPSWGSYYVTHIINRYKQERFHINIVRPFKSMLIHGLIYDTFFTLRFMIANFYYFMMVRFLHYYRLRLGWRRVLEDCLKELTLFQDYETITRSFFQENEEAKVLIVGHTHAPVYREFIDKTVFINTGTWQKMVSLSLEPETTSQLTYAKVEIFNEVEDIKDFEENVSVSLKSWAPQRVLPYHEFR
ncbi:MAG: hypothetical protein CME64_13535 [Halobacteriovoraceae bacterium]|nr:hypothetical protein [Halobacteriovoraceae bacterium]|tara:strand:- start:380 stop:1528 length:1149 start_codon:yes stop_codon:yes gene_type:complete